MYLGKVIGRVVCSLKDSTLGTHRLLLVKRMPNGPAVVAFDAVGRRNGLCLPGPGSGIRIQA